MWWGEISCNRGHPLLYMYENSIMKPTKTVKIEGRGKESKVKEE
jgi:hypothetical protein